MQLTIARICLIVFVLATLTSLGATWSHVGDDQYTLHAQLHFGRESFSTLAIVAISVLIMFAPAARRSRLGWIVMTINVSAVTLGFWISLVVVGKSLSLGAAADHIVNTVAGLLAVLLSWRSFNQAAAVTSNT